MVYAQLDFYNENTPKGTPFSTGYTFNAGNSGFSFYAFSSCTDWIKPPIEFYVESGTSFGNFYFRYPNLHTTGVKEHTCTETGFHGLLKFCDKVTKLPDGQGNEYMFDSGTTFFKFEWNPPKPIHLINGDTDYLRLAFSPIYSGRIDVKIKGWRVLSTDDGV